MKTEPVFRKDYVAPSHDIESTDLIFDLYPNRTKVTSKLLVIPRDERTSDDLVLDGEAIKLDNLKINGEDGVPGQYHMEPGKLIIHNLKEPTEIEIVTTLNPKMNEELSGLYMSNGNYITQCEAQGFRRITYYPDRPDILSKFRVSIHAPKEYKVLLSNGNLDESGILPDGRSYAVWVDPFPKPSYLFALVAGNFVALEEKIKLRNGKEVLLQIWTEQKNKDKTQFAMQSLIKAIRWDEERFDLELDLDRFMIVATDDFNMGAMENKGLNIFNSQCVLATPKVATDKDFEHIEATIGHEYFHNWTGDRITCRDWFQLSLKEGLTVFREQEFTADMLGDASARAVKRIQDVRALRQSQFAEDAGPMAHPVRPESYQSIDNFYTMTVYEKGAEVVRMYQTMFGKDGFKRGLREYINRFDGTAATCDDFRIAMAESNGADLEQFDRWYSQAGTPSVFAEGSWDPIAHTYTLKLRQSNRSFPGQPAPEPLMIPIKMGLLNKNGNDIPLQRQGEEAIAETSPIYLLTEKEETWVFENIPEKPVLSIGRDFSAPVNFVVDYSEKELMFLALHDSDLFNRADAFERLSLIEIDRFIEEIRKTGHTEFSPREDFLLTFEDILQDERLSPAYRAEILTLPSEAAVGEHRSVIEPKLIRLALDSLKAKIGLRLKTLLEDKVKFNDTGVVYSPTHENAGKRALKLLSLSYLGAAQIPKSVQQIRNLFNADNLTDQLAALNISATSSLPVSSELLEQAEIDWNNEPLLRNKWLRVHSNLRTQKGGLKVVTQIRNLMENANFSRKNPNSIYSLFGAFFRNGGPEFHTYDGWGYQLWIDTVLAVDRFNPQVAARLARSLENWRRYEPKLASMMYMALRSVQAQEGLSPDLKEIIDKALNEPL